MTREKILSLDYGTKRVGVAVSAASLAEPVVVLANDERLMRLILNLINEYDVSKIVIGMSENEMAKQTRTFAAKLGELTPLPIVFVDETLSSHQVHERLRMLPAKKRRGAIDHLAAAVILENYLQTSE